MTSHEPMPKTQINNIKAPVASQILLLSELTECRAIIILVISPSSFVLRLSFARLSETGIVSRDRQRTKD